MLSTVTSTILLEGLKDAANQTMWRDYVDRYQPMIVRYVERLGIVRADADDIAQDALLAFANGYRDGKYDRDRGRLRAWLFGIAHTTTRNWFRQNRRRDRQVVQATDQTDFFARIEDEDRLAALWDEEWRAAVIRQCLDEVRREIEESTYRAFDEFARKGRPAHEVARELQITENAVYGSKRRVLARLRELMPAMEATF